MLEFMLPSLYHVVAATTMAFLIMSACPKKQEDTRQREAASVSKSLGV
jgi:hypothetical protein